LAAALGVEIERDREARLGIEAEPSGAGLPLARLDVEVLLHRRDREDDEAARREHPRGREAPARPPRRTPPPDWEAARPGRRSRSPPRRPGPRRRRSPGSGRRPWRGPRAR